MPASRHCTTCGGEVRGGLTRDAIAKQENPDPYRNRRPKARTLRALCAALSTPLETVLPENLQPGGPPVAPSPAAQARKARQDYNEGMVDFADALGRPELYTNGAGRRYYSRELKDLYARYLEETGAGAGAVPAVA